MTAVLSEVTVPGAALHEGDLLVEHLPDGTCAEHRIDHFAAYPGPFCGDTARRAYDADGTWCCTVADHETFHKREKS